MKCIIADDTPMHINLFKSTIDMVAKELKLDLIIVGEAHNGKELVRVYKEKSAAGKVDIIFSDIRMPEMDGLSALVKIKGINPNQKIIMVSSEDMTRMEKLNASYGEQKKASVEFAKKIDLLDKVAERIKFDQIEEGKINSVLSGPETLAQIKTRGWGVPVIMVTSRNKMEDIARMLEEGAEEYIMKPFTAEVVIEKIEDVLGKKVA